MTNGPRYLVFGGCDYYPAGGWNDFVGAYLFKDDAVRAAKESIGPKNGDWGTGKDWVHIIDLETMDTVPFA